MSPTQRQLFCHICSFSLYRHSCTCAFVCRHTYTQIDMHIYKTLLLFLRTHLKLSCKYYDISHLIHLLRKEDIFPHNLNTIIMPEKINSNSTQDIIMQILPPIHMLKRHRRQLEGVAIDKTKKKLSIKGIMKTKDYNCLNKIKTTNPY